MEKFKTEVCIMLVALIIVALFVVLDLAALRWGFDSTDSKGGFVR